MEKPLLDRTTLPPSGDKPLSGLLTGFRPCEIDEPSFWIRRHKSHSHAVRNVHVRLALNNATYAALENEASRTVSCGTGGIGKGRSDMAGLREDRIMPSYQAGCNADSEFASSIKSAEEPHARERSVFDCRRLPAPGKTRSQDGY